MPDQDTERYSLTRAQLYDLISLAAYPQTSYPHITFGDWLLRNAIAPQPATADAVTEAAVRAARLDWEACQAKYAPYGSEWFMNPLEGDGYLRRRIMQDGLWLAFGKQFEPAYMAEARRLLDAGESEVRG